METRITGTVKWFSKEKGYGFICRDDNGEDIFVHHTGIHMNGFKTLMERQRVSFHIGMTDKGKRAVETKIIEGERNYRYESAVLEENQDGQRTQEST